MSDKTERAVTVAEECYAAGLAEGRRLGLEEAAKVCQDCIEGGENVINDPDQTVILRTARVLRDHIRALIEKKP